LDHPADNTPESRVLVPEKRTRIFGVVFILFMLYLVWTVVVTAWLRHPSSDRVVLGIVFMIICWSPTYFVAAHSFERITWNDQEIISETPWGSRRSIRWSDLSHVERLSDQPGVSRLELRSNRSGVLNVSPDQSGYEDFMRDVRRLAPADALGILEDQPLIPGFRLTRREGGGRPRSRPE